VREAEKIVDQRHHALSRAANTTQIIAACFLEAVTILLLRNLADVIEASKRKAQIETR
jgi:hypothetical protein